VSLALARLAGWLLCAALVLGACGRLGGNTTPFQGADITGSDIGTHLRLRDTGGAERTLADYRGKAVVVVFGFTHCPDVCPTTLANLAATMRQLGADAVQVQVLFVTIDPRRDTPPLLQQYVGAFDPHFIGLTGDEAAVQRTVKDFKLYVEQRPLGNGDYTVDHSAQVFAFDRQGRVRLVIPQTSSPEAIASDLHLLLNG
jgi:protein SCO1/2